MSSLTSISPFRSFLFHGDLLTNDAVGESWTGDELPSVKRRDATNVRRKRHWPVDNCGRQDDNASPGLRITENTKAPQYYANFAINFHHFSKTWFHHCILVTLVSYQLCLPKCFLVFQISDQFGQHVLSFRVFKHTRMRLW